MNMSAPGRPSNAPPVCHYLIVTVASSAGKMVITFIATLTAGRMKTLQEGGEAIDLREDKPIDCQVTKSP